VLGAWGGCWWAGASMIHCSGSFEGLHPVARLPAGTGGPSVACRDVAGRQGAVAGCQGGAQNIFDKALGRQKNLNEFAKCLESPGRLSTSCSASSGR